MERQLILSKSVAAAAYSETDEVLEVEYFNGMVYRFYGVQAELGNRALKVEHADDALNELISGHFRFEFFENVPPIFCG